MKCPYCLEEGKEVEAAYGSGFIHMETEISDVRFYCDLGHKWIRSSDRKNGTVELKNMTFSPSPKHNIIYIDENGDYVYIPHKRLG